MLKSILIDAVAGARSMTPLAAVSLAAAAHRLPRDSGAPGWLGRPAVAVGATALAAGELLGDKLPTAPDRIVVAGLGARVLTAAIAGAALAPRRKAGAGAAAAALAAVVASWPTWGLRVRAMRSFGRTPTGLVEDALVVASAAAVVLWAGRRGESGTRILT